MATRGPDATLLAPPAGLLCAMFASGLALAGVACASAAVENVIKQDAGANGGTGGAGGSGGQGGRGGAGGAGGTTASTGVCDPFSSSGCASGEKCTALQDSGALDLGCGSKGSRSAGETCNQVWSGSRQTGDDCGAGLACFKLATETTPVCRRICAPAASSCACGADEICSLYVSRLDTLGYAFCRPVVRCQPLAQTGCASTEGCYFSTSACFTGSQCAGAGSKKPGESCSAANECEPGSTCLIIGSGGTCSSFCSTADGGTPACSGASTGGDICDPLGGDTGESDVGSCRQQP
jgi:hypothetical protein